MIVRNIILGDEDKGNVDGLLKALALDDLYNGLQRGSALALAVLKDRSRHAAVGHGVDGVGDCVDADDNDVVFRICLLNGLQGPVSLN